LLDDKDVLKQPSSAAIIKQGQLMTATATRWEYITFRSIPAI